MAFHSGDWKFEVTVSVQQISQTIIETIPAHVIASFVGFIEIVMKNTKDIRKAT